MTMLKTWKDIKRKRKNLSPRMVNMLQDIRTKGKVFWKDINGCKDANTLNALMERLLVKRDDSELYYVPCHISDETIDSYIQSLKNKKN